MTDTAKLHMDAKAEYLEALSMAMMQVEWKKLKAAVEEYRAAESDAAVAFDVMVMETERETAEAFDAFDAAEMAEAEMTDRAKVMDAAWGEVVKAAGKYLEGT